MDTITQQKYLMLFSSQLDQFKQARQGLWRCRCPYCGDSQRKATKTRGYFFWHEDHIVFKCHNCGVSTSLSSMLRDYNYTLYSEMKLEGMRPQKRKEKTIKTHSKASLEEKFSNVLLHYKAASADNVAGQYLLSRKIPASIIGRFIDVPSMVEFTRLFDKYKDKRFPDTPCVGIPFYIGDSISFVQLRVIDPNDKMRYMTIEVDGGPKLFGYNNINKSKMVSVLEGPFDSCFVNNAVANAGAGDNTNVGILEDEGCQLRFIFDKDYEYNKQVRKLLEQKIEQGYHVVIYDKEFEFKDMNDAIEAGWSIEYLNEYLDKRTFKGMKARLELARVMKC
jgi:DNA primase subunit